MSLWLTTRTLSHQKNPVAVELQYSLQPVQSHLDHNKAVVNISVVRTGLARIYMFFGVLEWPSQAAKWFEKRPAATGPGAQSWNVPLSKSIRRSTSRFNGKMISLLSLWPTRNDNFNALVRAMNWSTVNITRRPVSFPPARDCAWWSGQNCLPCFSDSLSCPQSRPQHRPNARPSRPGPERRLTYLFKFLHMSQE